MNTPKPNALKSLYGQGHAKATQDGGSVRKQEILTPPCILDALHELWQDGISLDPCADISNNVPAVEHYAWPWQNGLALPWRDRTYANPPFAKLKDWLAKSRAEASRGVEHVVLTPLRTQCEWFSLDYDAVAYLKRVRFVGFNHAYPAPLVALYSGPNALAFKLAFMKLSTQVHLGPPRNDFDNASVAFAEAFHGAYHGGRSALSKALEPVYEEWLTTRAK